MKTEKIIVTGTVQGIGYRPFVKRLADELGLSGCVKNSGGIVIIFVTAGTQDDIAAFCGALRDRAPAGAQILEIRRMSVSEEELPKPEEHGFFIAESAREPMEALPVFVPDLASCSDCIAEMRDPKDRRFRYPLISCAACGPRYSILRALPYDRERTTMGVFPMCGECAGEYRDDKRERRRHAQTISCHRCGPRMRFITGNAEYEEDEAMQEAVRVLLSGGVIGLKGVGGYQLLADPCREEAVQRIRELKGRESKPFAVLFPSIDKIKDLCEVTAAEEKLLLSATRPIVLLQPRGDSDRAIPFPAGWSGSVLAGSAFIGAFLPASGMHQMLADECGPLIATSANLSGEPMAIQETGFTAHFMNSGSSGADGVLTHSREILAPVDDSVVFVDREQKVSMIRRARGYVPMPVFLRDAVSGYGRAENGAGGDILAFGADMKAAFALARGDRIVVSQPFGDLESLSVSRAFLAELERLTGIYDLHPERIVCDAHPSYHSTHLAEQYAVAHGLDAPVRIWHHHAHALAVMAQAGLRSCVAIVCDGTGYGTDGTVWGGEILICIPEKRTESGIPDFTRVWHLPVFRLVGGERASADSELAAASLLLTLGKDTGILHMTNDRERTVRAAFDSGTGVLTSSTGRLFDAVACILSVSRLNRYEGESAQALEAAAHRYLRTCGMKEQEAASRLDLSLSSYLDRLTDAPRDGQDPGQAAFGFHAALAGTLVREAERAARLAGETKIVLSGGCFANRILLELVRKGLRDRGLEAVTGTQLPAGDGGIGAGQAYACMI